MGLISMVVDGLRGGPRAAADPMDERHWTNGLSDFATALGIHLTPTEALQASCIFAGTKIYAETIGMLPVKVIRKVDARTREVLDDHWVYDALAVDGQPNVWQTGQQFRETLTAHMTLWGNAFAERIEGMGGYPEQLIPLHPDSVTVEQLTNYRLRYRVRQPDGTERVLLQDQVFRLQGLGLTSGIIGENVIRLAREAVGLWLAMEKYAALFFGQGARPGIWLEHPSPNGISERAWKRIREDLIPSMSGLRNMHKLQVAEEGMKVKEFGFSAEDAQMVEARQEQVREVARWMRLPEHMLASGKQPTYASVTEFSREFLDYSLKPPITRWESSVNVWLILEKGVKFKHNVDALLRGHAKDRAEAARIWIETGVKNRNEVRAEEDYNPVDGLDEHLTPLNMQKGSEETEAEPEPSRTPPSEGDEALALARMHIESVFAAHPPLAGSQPHFLPATRRLRLIAEEAARSVVRKELAATLERAEKLAGKPAEWRAWVHDFYERHAALVSEKLQLEPAVARDYCNRHRDELLARGVEVLETWQTSAATELAALAIEETVHA